MRAAREGRRAPNLSLELALCRAGFVSLAGLDEAGRGAWAGPLVAAAVVLPLGQMDLTQVLFGVRDSKQMRPGQREHWEQRIREVALAAATGVASAAEVDERGPLGATRLAMQRALQDLPALPAALLIDHLRLPEVELPQTALPGGDARVLSIAAASVVAKVTRDRLMVELAQDYPGYDFEQHKGYGTARHRGALRRLGPCPIHRFSYSPVAALVASPAPSAFAHRLGRMPA
ncbi:MAG: ribonuclease HII [Chloroflexota bacterium]